MLQRLRTRFEIQEGWLCTVSLMCKALKSWVHAECLDIWTLMSAVATTIGTVTGKRKVACILLHLTSSLEQFTLLIISPLFRAGASFLFTVWHINPIWKTLHRHSVAVQKFLASLPGRSIITLALYSLIIINSL